MALWKRKIVLMAGVAVGALALALIGDAVGLGQALTVAIAGTALALIIVIGGPWAFGEGRFALQEWDAVKAHQAAMVASKQQGGKAIPHIHFAGVEAMEDYLSIERGPVVVPARPTNPRGPFIEGKAEFVEVGGNGVGHED
jgi:hypothetical protein